MSIHWMRVIRINSEEDLRPSGAHRETHGHLAPALQSPREQQHGHVRALIP